MRAKELEDKTNDLLGFEKTKRLIVGGTRSGDNKSTGISLPDNVYTFVSFGTPTDLWGLSLVSDDINASNFGIALQYDMTIVATGMSLGIDVVQMKVYYKPNIGMFFVL